MNKTNKIKILILACDHTIFKTKVHKFFPEISKKQGFGPAYCGYWGVSRGRSVAVDVGCWLFALQRHFNNTSTALQWHFHGTLTEEEKRKNNCVVFYLHWSGDSVSPVCGIFVQSIFICIKSKFSPAGQPLHCAP